MSAFDESVVSISYGAYITQNIIIFANQENLNDLLNRARLRLSIFFFIYLFFFVVLCFNLDFLTCFLFHFISEVAGDDSLKNSLVLP